jgi:hypothetical protein
VFNVCVCVYVTAIREPDGAYANSHQREAVLVPALRAAIQHAQQSRQASRGQSQLFLHFY